MAPGHDAPDDRERHAAVAAAFAAARRLAAGEAAVAGGHGLRAGAVPLVVTDAVWRPDAARLDEVAPFAARDAVTPAVMAPVGDPLEAALTAGGWMAVTAIALDTVPDGGDGPAGEEVGWDRAREVAAVLAAEHGAPGEEVPAVGADATGADAADDLTAALATVLASAVADDELLRIELGAEAGGPAAAMVVYEDAGAAVVMLASRGAGRMAAAALATARGLNKSAWLLREVAPDAPDALLRRWERPA